MSTNMKLPNLFTKMKHTAQETYSTLVSGFDVEIMFNETGDLAEVELFEAGAAMWTTEIDLTTFLNDSGETYTEDLISAAASAAVDLFEAERDTLGQGAEALTIEGRRMQKYSFYKVLEWEDWYMGFKGTIFQDQATELLENYLDLDAATAQDTQTELNAAYQAQSLLIYQMSKLLFEKMKADPGGQTVIVINAKRIACGQMDSLEEWLNKFIGNRLEPQAIAYAKEWLDLSAKIENLDNTQTNVYETGNELRFAMEELKIQLMQAKLDQSLPEDGPEMAPKLMNDLFELADGVEFDEPLVPVSDLPVGLYSEPADSTQMFNTMSQKKAEADEVTGNEPVEVQELGQLAGGLQIAEVPVDSYPFNVSERVELSKEFEQVLWGGIKKTIPKGTKGVIDDLYDRAGDFYMIRFDDGRLVELPYEYLKCLKKSS